MWMRMWTDVIREQTNERIYAITNEMCVCVFN